MIFQTLSVHRSGRAADSRPRIQFCGDWLTEMGFVNGALIQGLPEPDGLVFNLCNDNINYSDLFQSTREKGGTLIRAYISNSRTAKGPTFVMTGKYIYSGGLKVGDALIAKCEHGLIRVRKVSGNVRLIHITKTKKKHTGEQVPMVFLYGDWLDSIGFTPDTLMTVATEPGCITFTAHDKAIIYSDVVKLARQNKMRLIQVSTHCGTTAISLQGSCAERAGFGVGDMVVAEYGHGVIKLQKLDPHRFAF